MKTVIYGGTFNPPHIGHERVVRLIDKAIDPDRFLVIPANVPPHKELETNSPTPNQRLEMCRLAFLDEGDIEVSDMEIVREGKSYTYLTLVELKEKYPEDTLYMVIGSDSLLQLHLWYRYEDILKLCIPVVISREENDKDALEEEKEKLEREFGAEIIILDFGSLVLSSTEIRKNKAFKDNVSEPVYEYIVKNGLYGV